MRKAHRTILAVLLAAAAITPLAAKVAPTIVAALASSERPAEDTARDADRKPGAVLDFAGIKRGTKVVELAPGGGYYTRLLSLAVGPGGRVYARGNRFSPAVEAWAKAHPNVLIAVTGPDTSALAPEPVDVVWTTLNYHDFKNVKLGDSDAAVWFNSSPSRRSSRAGCIWSTITMPHRAPAYRKPTRSTGSRWRP